MLPPAARDYLLNALSHTPATLQALLGGLASDDPAWDRALEPDRFTLREAVAHLADWESVFQERFERMVGEENPLLLRPDPGERAIERGYAQSDPIEALERFRSARQTTVAWLRGLPAEAGSGTGTLDRMGEITLEALVSLMLGHDAYHVRQVAEWLATP